MGRRSRRHSTGFGYIGFGNSQSTFNQKSSTPFSVYKEKTRPRSSTALQNGIFAYRLK